MLKNDLWKLLGALLPLAAFFLILSPLLFTGWSFWRLWNPDELPGDLRLVLSLVYVLYAFAYLLVLMFAMRQLGNFLMLSMEW